jgi:hypothetical protein
MNMKNKLFAGLLLSLFVTQACVKDEDKVFDASAAERMNAAIQTYRAALCAAPNGWVVEYYPETDRSLGGYNLICKFSEDGTVVLANELSTTNYPAGNPATSTYDIIANEGAMLTFNTYNETLHAFTEPHGSSDVDGYAGDYEFVFREVTPEQIVMTGKKYGNEIVLTPYAGGDPTTWESYLKQFEVMDGKIAAPVYLVKVDGTAAAIDRVTRINRTFQFDYGKAEDNKIVPYITTPTGIKLYEPLTVNGKTAQYFTFNATEETLTAVEPGVDMVIELSALPPNVFLAETTVSWDINIPRSSKSVQAYIDTCALAVVSGEGETLKGILIGDSPFGALSPGRGFIFKSYGTKYWSAQYACDFKIVGDNLSIEYKNQGQGPGLNEKYYYAYYKLFLDTITAKSPYSVTVDNPRNVTEMTVTSVADPNFYFVATAI